MTLLCSRNDFKFFWLWALALLSCNLGHCQNIKANEGSYGIDAKHKIIVWQPNNLDSLLSNSPLVERISFDKDYIISDPKKKLSYPESNQVGYEANTYSLYITKLPIIHITIDTASMNSRRKILGQFTYFHEGVYIENPMGIRHRGNLSLTFPKKSYDIEFWTDSVGRQNKDIGFRELRTDDDWILDGLYNEPLRLRSFISMKLWQKIHKPYYQDREPKAKSGFDFTFVEVFRNDEYLGIYALSESVDRKQLALRKHDGNQVMGELFKAESYQDGTYFKRAPAFENVFPHWAGFHMEYPMIDYRAHWNDLARFVGLVANASDTEFAGNIEREVRIQNVMDYFILVNLLRATDNLGKNYYLGRYDAGEPYFFIPWDLDGVFGTIQDGKRIPTSDDILSNNLFNRLLGANPNGYRNELKLRWKVLRENDLSDTSLITMVDKQYLRFLDQKIYERENKIWPSKLSVENHYDYLVNWIKERTKFLDTYFDSL